jgi:hypothetical protein
VGPKLNGTHQLLMNANDILEEHVPHFITLKDKA